MNSYASNWKISVFDRKSNTTHKSNQRHSNPTRRDPALQSLPSHPLHHLAPQIMFHHKIPQPERLIRPSDHKPTAHPSAVNQQREAAQDAVELAEASPAEDEGLTPATHHLAIALVRPAANKPPANHKLNQMTLSSTKSPPSDSTVATSNTESFGRPAKSPGTMPTR